MRKIILLVVFVLIVLSGCTNTNPNDGIDDITEKDIENNITFTNISAEEFAARLENKDFFLLDVHIPEQEHIEGTDAFIPFNEIEANLEKLPADKSKPMVVYCRSGSIKLTASNNDVE